jgi:DNA-binding response OmpR family regulator
MPPPRPRSCRILVVDDHRDTLDLLARLFRNRGHAVDTAATCAQARAAAAAVAPELVVGDVGLPDGDGAHLLAELKRIHGCATVAFTGFALPTDVARFTHRDSGIDHVIPKPANLRDVVETVEQLCDAA